MDYVNIKLDSLLKDLIPLIKKYEWSGLVTSIDNPIDKTGKSSLDIIKGAFDKITTLPRDGRDLSSFQLQFGYKNLEFNDIYIINGYENKDLKLPKEFKLPVGQSFQINVDKLPVTEAGIQITLDSNNRLNQGDKKSPEIDFKKLLKHQKSLVSRLPEELSLVGVINGCI
jgi:hypothetical protein